MVDTDTGLEEVVVTPRPRPEIDNETFKELLDLGATFAVPRVGDDGVAHYLIPDGYKIASVAKARDPEDAGKYVRRHPEFLEAASFIDYVRDFSNDDHTRIFFDPDEWVMQAVLDYDGHTGHSTGDIRKPIPSLGVHRASLSIRKSREYTAWTAFMADGKKGRTQQEFAEFVENNIVDFLEPNEAAAAELASNILNVTLKQNISFTRNERLQDGSIQFSFSAENQPGSIVLPPFVKIAIPILRGAKERIALKVLVRYRLQGQAVLFFLSAPNLERAVDESVEAIVAQVKDETDLPVHISRLVR